MTELEKLLLFVLLIAVVYRLWLPKYQPDIYLVEWRWLPPEGREHFDDWNKTHGSATLELMKFKVLTSETRVQVLQDGNELLVRTFYRFTDFAEAKYMFEKFSRYTPPSEYAGSCVYLWKMPFTPFLMRTIAKDGATLLERSKPQIQDA